MKNSFLPFPITTLCLSLLLLCSSVASSYAATITWSNHAGRERLTITKGPSEGLAGNIARVDKNGLIIPFSEVPKGLIISEPPTGSTIFSTTQQLGRSLAIMTQTDKFGFVVSKQTPGQVVIDFFEDDLGSRWKATVPPPLSGAAPNYGIENYAEAPFIAPQAPAVGWGEEKPVVIDSVPSDTQPEKTPQTEQGTASIAPDAAPVTPVATTGGTSASESSRQTIIRTPVPENIPAPESTTATSVVRIPANIQRNTVSSAVAQPTEKPDTLATPMGLSDTAGAKEQGNATHIQASTPIATTSMVAPSDTTTTTFVVDQTTPVSPSNLWAQNQPVPTNAPTITTGQNIPVGEEIHKTSIPEINLPSASVEPPTSLPTSITHDTRKETGDRVAPLPEPGLVVASVAPPAISVQHEPIAPVTTQGSIPAQTPPSTERQTFAAVPGQAEVTQNTPIHGTPAQSVVAPDISAENLQVSASPAQIPIERASVRGRFHAGGIDTLPDTFTPTQKSQDQEGQIRPPQEQGTPEKALQEDQTQPRQTPDEQGTAQEVIQSGKPTGQTPEQTAEQKPAEQIVLGDDITPPVSSAAVAEDVIYVNEYGEEVSLPADPARRLKEIRMLISDGLYNEALTLIEELLTQTNLDIQQHEEALHIRAEMAFIAHKDALIENAQTIIDLTNQAININIRSPRNAAALLRLGYLNLKLENIAEAEARFNLLRRMYPNDENVPLSYYYWGDYYYNRGDLQRAADEFQVVLQKYPDSEYAREASLGLARSFYRLGYYEQAFAIVEYIEQRWPRFYLYYPPFLNMMGDVAYRLNNYEYAVKQYWLYANLEPYGEEVDVILTRIGDIYSVMQLPEAAREVYVEATKRFPDTDGGLIALMRIAEESINNEPTLARMFDAFDAFPRIEPVTVYKKIINDHPTSGLVPLAQLKLAMWYLWKHDYMQALDAASDFLIKHPNDELATKAREVALKTFAVMAAESVSNGSYSRMRSIWEKYPVLQEQEEILTPESRVALGVSYWNDGRADDALVALEPFFLGKKIPEYSEMALNLVLTIYLEYEEWAAIEEVSHRVGLWEIDTQQQLQLDYALALAYENQGKTNQAVFIWKKLYDSKQLPDEQMVYTTYFLARGAEKNGDSENAYLLGVEALRRLQVEANNKPAEEDSAKIKSQISSLMVLTEDSGRLGEALSYADQYLEYLPESDPDRAAVLFRMARIYKKQGDDAAWQKGLEEVAAKYPNSVYGQTATATLNSDNLKQDASRYSPIGE